jgi:2-aminoethylphosphonate transport system substrate-binding protein
MQGVSVWQPDWNEVLQKLPAYVKRWNEATGS